MTLSQAMLVICASQTSSVYFGMDPILANLLSKRPQRGSTGHEIG